MAIRIQSNDLPRMINEVLFEVEASRENPLTEQELATRLDVSRTPVRDALCLLQQDGIIERKQRRGIYLRTPSLSEIVEIYEIRAALEGFAARKATLNATKRDIAELKKYARQFSLSRKKNLEKRKDEANIAFHGKIVELAKSDLLSDIMERFNLLRRAFMLRHQFPVDLTNVKPPYPHEDIIKKMEEGDAEGCGRMLESHILWAKDLIVEHSSRDSS